MLKEKYARTDEGARNIRQGALWTVMSNVAAMAGIGFFFVLMQQLVDVFLSGAALPQIGPYVAGLAVFAVVFWVANWFQYDHAYGKTYRESGRQRIALAERLRVLPLSFFGRRDLADLTETIMTDATTMGTSIRMCCPTCTAPIFPPLLSPCAFWYSTGSWRWRHCGRCPWRLPCCSPHAASPGRSCIARRRRR